MREMKDSGVEWIGEIPEDWDIVPTKRFFRSTKRVVGNEVDNYERLALTMNGVIKRSKEDSEGLQPEQFEGYQILRKNELVFKLIDLENVRTSRVGLSPYTGLVSPAYIVLTNESKDNRFYYYWFMSMYYNEIFNHIGGDGVRSALNARDLATIPVVSIPIHIQHCIADYLDEQCAKIDTVIAKQRELIIKLGAYKQSIIIETVTKGLNSNVEMKDSGVVWIGKIPCHWNILKLKAHTSMLTPMRDKPQDLDGEIPWIRIEDYVGKYISESKEGFGVSIETVNEMNLKIYPVGTILCTSSCDLGKCAIVSKELVSNQRFIGIIPDDKTLPDYLYYLMLSNTERLNHLSTGTIQANLSRVAFEHLLVQFPPYEEQKEIVGFLDKKCNAIDNATTIKQKMIDRLIAYKKSLIYETVTGKREI